MAIKDKKNLYFESTRRAVIWMSLFNEPLQVLYFSFLSMILYRDLKATPFQIAALTTLRPVIALLSLYWSSIIARKNEKLVTNLIITGILARVPFFFFPFTNNPWFIIASSTSFMMLSRGGIPAWIEIMKQNLPEEHRSKIFSFSSALGYIEGVLLAVGMGILLDNDSTCWKWLFPVTATIGLIGIGFKAFIPERLGNFSIKDFQFPSLKEFFISPWRDSWRLVQERPDFGRFQWGFMFAGSAIMMIQPALPLFFVDFLHITYLDLAIALSVCKGLGFAITSSYWTRVLQTTTIFETSNRVCILLSLFPLALMCALIHPYMLYAAYFLYGIGQSGSHLVWHLSGASFAKNRDSSPYSNVNILTVGVRGIFAPPLGSAITVAFGPLAAFAMSIVVCLYAKSAFFKEKILQATSRLK